MSCTSKNHHLGPTQPPCSSNSRGSWASKKCWISFYNACGFTLVSPSFLTLLLLWKKLAALFPFVLFWAIGGHMQNLWHFCLVVVGHKNLFKSSEWLILVLLCFVVTTDDAFCTCVNNHLTLAAGDCWSPENMISVQFVQKSTNFAKWKKKNTQKQQLSNFKMRVIFFREKKRKEKKTKTKIIQNQASRISPCCQHIFNSLPSKEKILNVHATRCDSMLPSSLQTICLSKLPVLQNGQINAFNLLHLLRFSSCLWCRSASWFSFCITCLQHTNRDALQLPFSFDRFVYPCKQTSWPVISPYHWLDTSVWLLIGQFSS